MLRKYFSIVLIYSFLALTMFSCDKAVETRPPENKSVPIFINEFLARNKYNIRDELNESDDWIELYNAADTSVSCKNLYLTDSLPYSNRWRLPDTIINPRGFLLVWADSEIQQGKMHASFRLGGKHGEQIGLFFENNGTFEVVDSITYGIQYRDTSYGRCPDGGLPWRLFPTPTPSNPNC